MSLFRLKGMELNVVVSLSVIHLVMKRECR